MRCAAGHFRDRNIPLANAIMEHIETIAALREQLATLRLGGRRLALAPTMGNLHEGHERLINRAQVLADDVAVSVFVNPAQFGPREDYQNYPRSLDSDLARLEHLNVRIVFTPSNDEMYPADWRGSVWVDLPDLSGKLCGAFRPGHFRGVATVVAKLFNLIQPDVAVFGEKDYQQVLIVRRMVEALHFPVRIETVATLRDPEGLALSSRNQYLTTEERDKAALLYRCLCDTRDAVRAGDDRFRALEEGQIVRLEAAGFRPDYFSICRREDLEPAHSDDRELLVAAAAWLGKARLIDNVLVDLDS